jgi:hypothetical protein
VRLTTFSLAALAAVAVLAGAATAAPSPAEAYEAGVAYAACMRAHGVPHPDPDRAGNFRLTPAQEQRLREAGRAKVQAADRACFHHLKPVVSTRPLTPQAKAKAVRVLEELRACVRGRGFRLGDPLVRNLTRGRAFFGFAADPKASKPSPAMTRAEHACEREVQLAEKLDAIVAADRSDV